MTKAEHTPGPWIIEVTPCSIGLESTGYTHGVKIGIHRCLVAFTRHKNYDYIHTTPVGNGYVQQTGIGRREPDLTPHPDARLIAAAPELLSALEGIVNGLGSYVSSLALRRAQDAIAQARGEPS